MEREAVMNKPLLDREQTYQKFDPQNMITAVESFASHCREAQGLALDVELTSIDTSRVRNIFILGMGGSGVGGNILGVLYEDKLPLSITTIKDYDPPAALDDESLVFAVSYSGNTEETMSAVGQAISRHAQVVAVTSGGKLQDLAEEHNLPCVRVPSGLQPRAALGYLAIPLMVMVERLWPSLPGTDFEALFEFIDTLSKRWGHTLEHDSNSAKVMAERIKGRMPVIYGCSGASGVAAMRWKTQLNENAKTPAYFQIFSELDHNEIVGWHNLLEMSKNVIIIMLHDGATHIQNRKRIEITKNLIEDNVGDIMEIEATGETMAQQLLGQIYFGDFISVYLALTYATDPTPVDRIESLKKMLTG